MKRFENKVALITGGSSGIGEATARLLAEEGAKVAVVASSDLEKAQRSIETFNEEARVRAHAFVADLSDVSNIKNLVKQVRNELGEIDILINSAGFFYPTPIEHTSEEAFDKMLNVNLKAMFFTIAEVVPGMKSRCSGKIVNLASVAGMLGATEYSLYCASKAAVMMLTRALALELAKHKININAVAPGNTETPMNEPLRTDPAFADMLEKMKQGTPSPRCFTPAEEMARCVAFLVSDEARSMYGSTLLADEGAAAGL